MKTFRIPLALASLLAVATILLLQVRHPGPAAALAVDSLPAAQTADPASTEAAPAAASLPAAPATGVAKPAPVPGVASTTEATKGGGPDLKDNVELAYQLGEDITKLSPDAIARLRADWDARIAQARVESAAAQQ